MTPQGNITFTLTEMRDLKGNPITDAKGSGHFVEIPLSQDVDVSYALLIRNLPHAKGKHYCLYVSLFRELNMALLITSDCINCDMCLQNAPIQLFLKATKFMKLIHFVVPNV